METKGPESRPAGATARPELSQRPASGNPGRVVPEPGRAGVPYIPLPDSRSRTEETGATGIGRRNGLRVLLAAGVLAALVGAAWLKFGAHGTQGGAGAQVVAPAAQSAKVLWLAQAEYDEEATRAAREALASAAPPPLPANVLASPGVAESVSELHSRAPAAVAAPSQALQPGKAATLAATAAGALAPVAAVSHQSPQQRAQAALARMPASARASLASGKTGLFTLHVVDTDAEDGDGISLTLDGVYYGAYLLSNRGFDVTIPVAADSASLLVIRAIEDGGGGVTFGAVSSSGEVRTRVMQVGEIETWAVKRR